MDIPSLSMNLTQNNLLSSVGTAVLAQSLDMAESTGAAITELIDTAAMEHSVYPELGGNIDVRI